MSRNKPLDWKRRVLAGDIKLSDVPDEIMAPEFCLALVRASGHLFYDLPKSNRVGEVADAAVACDPYLIRYVTSEEALRIITQRAGQSFASLDFCKLLESCMCNVMLGHEGWMAPVREAFVPLLRNDPQFASDWQTREFWGMDSAGLRAYLVSIERELELTGVGPAVTTPEQKSRRL